MDLKNLTVEQLSELAAVDGGWCGGIQVVWGGNDVVCITIHWQ